MSKSDAKKPLRHISAYDVIEAFPGGGGTSVVEYELRKGETSWDPTRTGGRVIGGPAHVKYTLYPDGGVEAVVTAPKGGD